MTSRNFRFLLSPHRHTFLGRVQRRSRRDGKRGLRSGQLTHQARAESHALLALTEAGPEARVALHRLEIVMTERDRLLDLVERDVFAATDEHLVSHVPSPPRCVQLLARHGHAPRPRP